MSARGNAGDGSCVVCGKPTRRFPHGRRNLTCSSECLRLDRRPARPACAICGAPVRWTTRHAWGKTCSEPCENRIHSATMTRTNAVHALPATAARRMRERGPMTVEASRLKMADTLRRIGHRPPWTGGKGRGTTEPQRRLAEALGSEWVTEHRVLTGKALGLPACVYVDIAHVDRRVAIEVDGGSHATRKQRDADARKTAFLESRGWLVLRFTNRAVLADVGACVAVVAS